VVKISDESSSIFRGELQIYLSQGSVPYPEADAVALYPMDFLSTLIPPVYPSYVLKLKINQPLTLLRNMHTQNGICNGTRLSCKSFAANLNGADILARRHRGNHIFLPRILFLASENNLCPVKFRRCRRWKASRS
jgi:hypothetical protein